MRASLFHGAPILSEVGACVRESGHPGDHRDARGGIWYRLPLVPEGSAEGFVIGEALTGPKRS
ncbi:hypothetical protein [Streptomyces lacrimifluminis]|uniref:hypothetical protein n=1 Tax=Streptomyces lacrimifluminis TaxID=1500077 RepID=UPI001E631E97|nr:hypothetical protein [Streptomyces lacrimifluminis]